MSSALPSPTHVLVGTDFSPAAENALRRADAIAHQFGAKLSLLHVVEPLPLVSAWGDVGAVAWIGLEALQEAGLRALERQRDAFAQRKCATLDLHCRIGQPRIDLAEQAAELGADLLVLGGRAAPGIGERLFGSTARAVVHAAPLPLLVCRRPAASPWRTVLASTDFSAAAERAVALAERLAPEAFKRLLHVHAPLPEATLALLQPDPGLLERYVAETEAAAAERFQQVSARHPGWTGQFRRGAAIDVVEREAATLEVDLLALGTRGHGRWIGALLGSVGQRVLTRLDCDVLLVPERTPSGSAGAG